MKIEIDAEKISPAAAHAVRLSFNPSALPSVLRLKLIAAALHDEITSLGPSREASVALTQLQTTSMWAVAAATREL